MEQKNKHGLKRSIPPDVKLKVRKDCGFGCVICGSWICEYEHFDPEFKDAKQHDPKGIALLCDTHHEAKTKGLLTNAQVCSAKNKPYNIENGVRNNELFFTSLPKLFLCGNEIVDGGEIIVNLRFTSPFVEICKKENKKYLKNELSIPIVKIGTPKKDEPIPIFLSFYDSEEHLDSIFAIENNEWHGNANNFDIESIGTKLIIRKRKGKILLNIIFNTKENRIDINNIDITLPGMKLNKFLDDKSKKHGIDLNGMKLINSKIQGKVNLIGLLKNNPGQFSIMRE